ncbi:tetratricopeptide repeat protein [bacterium]|nr:tetratricopeptide repeat protein [bacterium]
MKMRLIIVLLLLNCSISLAQNINCGVVYLKEHKIEQAIREFEEALKNEQSNPLIYRYLGEAYLRDDNLDKAIEILKKGVDISPKSADMHYYLGEALRIKMECTSWTHFLSKMSIGEESWNELRESVKLDPSHFDAHFSLGLMYYYAPKIYGETDNAIFEFKTALKIKSDSANAHYWLGEAYYKKGEESLAIAEWEKTLDLDPKNKQARESLSKTKANKRVIRR